MGRRFFLHEKDTFSSAESEEYSRQGEGLVYHFGEVYRSVMRRPRYAPALGVLIVLELMYLCATK